MNKILFALNAFDHLILTFTAVEHILWPVGLTSSYIIEVVVCLIPKEIVKFIHN